MKVNDYVRYKRPFDIKETIMIGKILSIYEPDEKHKIKGYDLDTGDVISDEFSIKSSPNIIDLIEVGDYVNGKQVEWVGYDLYKEHDNGELEGIGEKRVLFNSFTKDSVRKSGIKSIVTHEQFSQIEYRIGE